MARIKKEDLEKNYEQIKTKVKRNKHPDEWKYPGRNGNEHKMALLSYMRKLSKEQVGLLSKGQFIFDPENTNKFFDEIKVGDLVGIKDTTYKVLSKDQDGFKGEVRNTDKVVDISLPAIDFGLATGFAQILWRGDAPYGVDAEEEVTILIKKPLEVESAEQEEKKV
jgi:hypothetical protein